MKAYVVVCAVADCFSAGKARSAIAIAKIIRKATATVVVLPFELFILFSPLILFLLDENKLLRTCPPNGYRKCCWIVIKLTEKQLFPNDHCLLSILQDYFEIM